MTAEEAIARLKALDVDDTDREIAHCRRDEILIAFLETVAPEVAEAAVTLEANVGFWYA